MTYLGIFQVDTSENFFDFCLSDAEMKRLLCLLEERLTQQDNDKKDVQNQLSEACTKLSEEACLLKEKIIKEISESFELTKKHILDLIEIIEEGEESNIKEAIKQAHQELLFIQRYEIEYSEEVENFAESCKLTIIKTEIAPDSNQNINKNETINKLRDYLNEVQESHAAAQNKITGICKKRLEHVEKMKANVNKKLELLFSGEYEQLQEMISSLRENMETKTFEEQEELKIKAEIVLSKKQKYTLNTFLEGHPLGNYYIAVTRETSLEFLNFENRAPSNIVVSFIDRGRASLFFTILGYDEIRALMELNLTLKIIAKVWERERGEETSRTITETEDIGRIKPFYIGGTLFPNTTYCLKMKIECSDFCTKWCENVEFTTPEFNALCGWRECPADVNENMKYSVDGKSPSIVIKDNTDNYCTIVGNAYIPMDTVTLWSVKILELGNAVGDDKSNIWIGVAPFDIDQNNTDNHVKCGWYFDCCNSKLWSGPPHNYSDKKYGPVKLFKQVIYVGDAIDVAMNTTKGELSFIVKGKSYGTAYKGIPLDKPLVPCVILGHECDSVELNICDMNENVNSSVPAPSNVTIKNATWDSITLIWDAVSTASFYQVEVDGSKQWCTPATNTYTKRGFLPETEHRFRVRTVRDGSVSEWSGVVKGTVLKKHKPYEGTWKKCPDDISRDRKYVVDEKNFKIASMINKDSGCINFCTIIGDIPLPLNTTISWTIKILKSRLNYGYGIHIGVAPFDVNQNSTDNYNKCGWYFRCYELKLWSGPPHNCRNKGYGPIRDKIEEYIHTGDSVGVVMNTINGELLFVINGVSYGVAYEGIPLDKPLVPCVLLREENDSIELETTPIKEIDLDSSISAPSNILIKNDDTWDSLTLTWDKVIGASFYQIETNNGKSFDASIESTFLKRGFLPDTEYSFRMRTVKESSVSEWSDITKGRTLKSLEFSECTWEKCLDDVDEKCKYFVDIINPRIATKINDCRGCTIIGDTFIPLNKTTFWSIRIIKSKNDDGHYTYIGVAPSDISQSDFDNQNRYGWYYCCYNSTLCSGPLHNYEDKEYGPRKEKDGHYVRTGDLIDVVVDTTKGKLSFILSSVNLGVAYEGIPLDKPLVPCVLLGERGDSIELDPSVVKEGELGSTILAPTNLKANNIACDSIILTWNTVSGAAFYQIEINGKEKADISTTNSFIKNVLLPDTEYNFRVRAVRGHSISEWSGVVKGKTLRAPDFSECTWDLDCFNKSGRLFSVSSNKRIATKYKDGTRLCRCCTIAGDVSIPLNTVTSWSIKVLKSRNGNGEDIFVGVAPADISQSDFDNYNKCGWYFYCYDSSLWSGPPHDFRGKEYGPRKENGQYARTGGIIDVVVDTAKSELSFILSSVNLGVAYERIPLDKPLVPCAIVRYEGDSVEFIN